MIALAISRNPHMAAEDHRQLSDMLIREINDVPTVAETTLDREGMNALKARLSAESRFIKVK